MWTRSFMRTAIIFLVAMAALAQQPAGNAETWVKLDDGVNKDWISVLAAGENRLYAGTEYGILISDDQGLTWRYVTLGFKHSPLSMAVDGNTVYVGTYSDGIFRSDDAGETWTPTSDGLRTFKHHLTHIKKVFWPNISQILVTFDEAIAVTRGPTNNTYLSTDRGGTWHNVTGIWAWWAQSIRSVAQFDGYLWCSVPEISSGMARSSDNGRTWEWIPKFKHGGLIDWVVLHHRLYVVEPLGFGRWNEQIRDWEYLPVEGLPMLSTWGLSNTTITSSAVHDDRLYVGVSEFNSNAGEQSGVYVFDSNTETWSSAGLAGVRITVLLSHDSILYAGTPWNGIYASTPQRVHPHAKAVTTWGRVKQDALAKD